MKTEIISRLTVSTRRREAAEQQTGAGQRDALHGRRSQGTTGRGGGDQDTPPSLGASSSEWRQLPGTTISQLNPSEGLPPGGGHHGGGCFTLRKRVTFT